MKTKEEIFAPRQFIFGRSIAVDRPLDIKEAEVLISKAEEIKRSGRLSSQSEIMSVFSSLSKAWSDASYPKRLEAQEMLKRQSGSSGEFISAVFNEFPRMISPDCLLKKIEAQLGGSCVQGAVFSCGGPDFRLIVQPAGLVLHVAAGNVFLGCVESIIDGIITRNINFLKMSSADRSFPLVFAESIKEFDPHGAACGNLAVMWWRGGDKPVEGLFKKRMDRIVFWGGGQALSSWQKDMGESTTLIVHGPKTSFGVISAAGMGSCSLPELTDRIALDIVIWEQKACSSPQALFIEESLGEDGIKQFLESLSQSLGRITAALPPAERTPDECVEIIRARELAVAKRIVIGKEVEVIGPDTFDWTIIFDGMDQALKPQESPLNRTIIVKRYRSLAELSVKSLAEYSSYLQTAGYCLGKTEVEEYATSLSRQGVTRICPFGVMAIPRPGAPHDGTFALRDLVKFISVE